MKDFALNIEQTTGRGTLNLRKVCDNIINNLYLSIMVKKGRFFFNPDFGLRDLSRHKCTSKTALLVKDYIEDALAWLKDIGRVKSIEVYTERAEPSRINAHVIATQAEGLVIEYQTFVEVV